MNERNGIPAPDLQAVLAEGAEMITPGPVPADGVLAGARRRAARGRMAAAAVGVLVLAGVGTGISVVGSGGHASEPLGPPTPSPRTWSQPTWTVVQGLAPGQAYIRDPDGPRGDGPGTVILSGRVDGVPWQLRAVLVTSPTAADAAWAGQAAETNGLNWACEYLRLEVGGYDLQSGFADCGSEPFLATADFGPDHREGTFQGHAASTAFAVVPAGTARVVVTVDGGPPLVVTPVAVEFSGMRIAVIPVAPAGRWTVRTFDAAGGQLSAYTETYYPAP